MSRMTPMTYYDVFVIRNLDDYEEMPHDIRRGMNASVSAFQLADVTLEYYWKHDPSKLDPWQNNKELLLKDLCKREPAFLTVQSVATAYKHLYTRDSRNVVYEIESGGALTSFHAPDDDVEMDSDWSNDASDVIVLRRDGSRASLRGALKSVVHDLWPKILPPEY